MENNNITIVTDQPPSFQTNTTLNLPPNPNHDHDITFLGDEVNYETLLDKTLQRLVFHLSFLGFNQTSILRFIVSWVVFLFVGIVIPVLILELKRCSSCQGYYQVKDFEYDVLISQALLGFVSLICVSHNLRKRGIRNFLFVDRYKGHTSRFMIHYIQKIKDSYRLLLWSLLPCFVLKLTHEIIRAKYVQNQAWWQVCVVVSAMTMSWTYLSAITLVACVLFHLACSLQVIHFNDYEKKLLERESNVLHLIEEHIRLRHYLSKISHRFRIYLLLIFVMVTSAFFVTLVQTTTSAVERVTFLNGGNFAVTSIVQVVETLLCLHAGTKISSKAYGISAVACKWHALATSRQLGGSRRSNSFDIVNRSNSLFSLTSNCSDSDLESLNSFPSSPRAHLASVSSYKERQSFDKSRRHNFVRMDSGSIAPDDHLLHRAISRTVRAWSDRHFQS